MLLWYFYHQNHPKRDHQPTLLGPSGEGLGSVQSAALLAAQRSAFDAESRLLAVRRQRLDGRIDLHLALGGGFSAEEEPLLSLDAEKQP